jgi:hypothetical protein
VLKLVAQGQFITAKPRLVKDVHTTACLALMTALVILAVTVIIGSWI